MLETADDLIEALEPLRGIHIRFQIGEGEVYSWLAAHERLSKFYSAGVPFGVVHLGPPEKELGQ